MNKYMVLGLLLNWGSALAFISGTISFPVSVGILTFGTLSGIYGAAIKLNE